MFEYDPSVECPVCGSDHVAHVGDGDYICLDNDHRWNQDGEQRDV